MPDAIINPHAVMIHPQHAFLAHSAVMRSRRLIGVALLAKTFQAFPFPLHLPKVIRIFHVRLPTVRDFPSLAHHRSYV